METLNPKTIRDAADYMEEYGWRSGGFGKYKEGPCCMAGALAALEPDRLLEDKILVTHNTLLAIEFGEALLRFVKSKRSDGLFDVKVPMYNDAFMTIYHTSDAMGSTGRAVGILRDFADWFEVQLEVATGGKG